MTRHISAEMRRCIENCSDCHNICVETAAHCLEMGGKHAEAKHVKLLLDCADICLTSANFMLRGSPMHVRTCAVCAELCTLCAEACEAFGDDALMRQCAEICRRCAESCRQMAGAHAA